jgi:hypothetical protein
VWNGGFASRQQRQKQASPVQHSVLSAAQLPVEHSTAQHRSGERIASSVRKVRLVRALELVRSPRTAGGRALVGIVATVSIHVSVVKMQMMQARCRCGRIAAREGCDVLAGGRKRRSLAGASTRTLN